MCARFSWIFKRRAFYEKEKETESLLMLIFRRFILKAESSPFFIQSEDALLFELNLKPWLVLKFLFDLEISYLIKNFFLEELHPIQQVYNNFKPTTVRLWTTEKIKKELFVSLYSSVTRSVIYLTNRFHFAVCLWCYRSQMILKKARIEKWHTCWRNRIANCAF